MILADKITDLRKKNGWSQEELANRLGVSRQAVSKWESAGSIPDLNKIIKMSDLFSVSTDYLLKDSLENEEEITAIPERNVSGFYVEEENLRPISLEDANCYLGVVRNAASKIAFGVLLCILSPVLLIWLGGLSDKEGGYVIAEGAAVGIGMTVLLLSVAAAVALFLIYGRRLEQYEFLEKEPVELAYGVKGMVENEKQKYEGIHSRRLVLGVLLCILSAVPIMVLAVNDEDGMLAILGVILCLILVAIGVFLIVLTCTLYGSFQKLLEEGDYTRRKKMENKRNDIIDTIYWCTVTAVYLGWSFATMKWHRTWIVWPVAGVFYGAVIGISSILRQSR